jgi:hypothetical protein
MAREAASEFLRGVVDPTNAVIKVASACGRSLTNEHVRRICEMTYHDVYERSFRDSPGPDRLVSFDPPDATKAADAVRTTQIASFHDKVASSRGGGAMGKTAEAPPIGRAPAAKNAFLSVVSTAPEDRTHLVKEARFQVRDTHRQLREAARQLETEVHSAAGSEKIAFIEMQDTVLSVVRNGAPPLLVMEACLEFAKTASSDAGLLSGMATDLIRFLDRCGVDLQPEKTASMEHFRINEAHPLRVQAIKVAELRGFRVRGELALQDIREQMVRVERELQDALYQ